MTITIFFPHAQEKGVYIVYIYIHLKYKKRNWGVNNFLKKAVEERRIKKSKTRHCRPWHVIDGAARYLLIPPPLSFPPFPPCAEQFIISVCFSLTLYATYSIIFIQSAVAKLFPLSHKNDDDPLFYSLRCLYKYK